MDTGSLLNAGKLPRDLLPWKSKSGHMNAMLYNGDAFLFDAHSGGSFHTVSDEGFGGFTIMDDSDSELSRHLQAVWLAEGRILKTGLGFGCFVRMALGNSNVEHIDVIEKDPEIASHFGRQFRDNPRVTIHVQDAFDFVIGDQKWNLAWHDIYCDGNNGLARMHFDLMIKFRKAAKIQSAWAIDRWARRLLRVGGVRTF